MAQNISTKIVDKTKEDDYPFAKKVRDYRKLIRFYLIPIVSVLIFLFILVFTIVPSVRHMIDGLEEGKELREESKHLDSRINRLTSMRENDARNRQILSKINQIIPSEQTEVVRFRQKVAGVGTNKGLEIDSLQAGETIVDGNNRNVVASTTNFQLIEIPSKFGFTGGFNGFRELFRDLYAGDDFFVISHMDLNVNNMNVGLDSWEGRFDLTKYQFYEDNPTRDYADVSETEPVNQQVIRFLEENFGI